MEFKLNCINIWNKVSVLGSFFFCFTYVQTLVYNFYFSLYIYYILFPSRVRATAKCVFQKTALHSERIPLLPWRAEPSRTYRRWQGIRSDVIILDRLAVDVAVVDEDSHHTLEYALLHLAQFRDLLSYGFHTDVCRQLSFPPGCVNSSWGKRKSEKRNPSCYGIHRFILPSPPLI